MESGNPFDLRALAEILREKDSDSESDTEEGHAKASSLHPGTIGSVKKDEQKPAAPGAKVKVDKKGNEAIWSSGEVAGGNTAEIRIPDISNDPRLRPEVDVKYMQDVCTEDVFLGMSDKTPGSGSCEWIVVKISMTGETDHNSFHLDLKENWIELRSQIYALVHVLPHRINPRLGNAKWDQEKATLTLTLKIIRDWDPFNNV